MIDCLGSRLGVVLRDILFLSLLFFLSQFFEFEFLNFLIFFMDIEMPLVCLLSVGTNFSAVFPPPTYNQFTPSKVPILEKDCIWIEP